MKTNEITHAGIALALIMVCYIMFKGTLNIVNALLVPLLLYGCFSRQGLKGAVATLLAFLFLCVIINPLQIIFSIFYILSALLLCLVTREQIKFPLKVLIMSGGVFISFLLSIKLTDHIFLTRIETFMLLLVGGNYFFYLFILFLEGLLVGTALVYAAKLYDERVKPWVFLETK